MHATESGRHAGVHGAHRSPPPPPAPVLDWAPSTARDDSTRHADGQPPALVIHPPAPYRVTGDERTRRSERALAAERRIGRAAYLLDDLVTIPGTKIGVGLDPVIGLVPFLGDAVSGLVSAWIVLEAARFHLPKIVIVRMVMNALVDFGVGLIPFLGDIVDFGFKGNRRNLELFHRHAVDLETNTAGSQALVIGLVAVGIGIVWLLLGLLGNLLSTVVG